MKILLTPQVNDLKISYQFKGETITATVNDMVDTFDFSSFPDGEIFHSDITTILPFNPVVYAVRDNGVLSVQLLNPITDDASEADKFPSWVEV
jgi:hypothetical protein